MRISRGLLKSVHDKELYNFEKIKLIRIAIRLQKSIFKIQSKLFFTRINLIHKLCPNFAPTITYLLDKSDPNCSKDPIFTEISVDRIACHPSGLIKSCAFI